VYWWKNLGHCWDFLSPPVIRHQRNCALLSPSLRRRCDTSRQSAHLWSSQNPECWTTSPNWKITATLVRSCVQNVPQKTGEASSAAKHTGKWPRDRPRPSYSDYISDLVGSRLMVEPAELSQTAVDREVFQVLLGLLPSDLPRGKSGVKMNEMNNIFLI